MKKIGKTFVKSLQLQKIPKMWMKKHKIISQSKKQINFWHFSPTLNSNQAPPLDTMLRIPLRKKLKKSS